jgi:hypothetical protein
MKHPSRIKYMLPHGLITCTLLAFSSAHAAEPANSAGDSVFASIGIGGLDLGYGKRFNNRWGGRVMLNSGIKGDADNVKIHGNRYDAEYKKGPGVGILADLYPINDSGFRVSGGLYIANHKAELDGRGSTASYNFNGHSYSSAQVGRLTGETKFQSVAPYLGIGWESGPSKSGWRFVSDLGVKYIGKSSSKLDASGAASNAALRQDIAAERKHLKEDVAELIATVGVSYSF